MSLSDGVGVSSRQGARRGRFKGAAGARRAFQDLMGGDGRVRPMEKPPEGDPQRTAVAALDPAVISPGAALTRPPVQGGRAGLLPQLVVAGLCGGYAIGAALGWGSAEVA